MKQIKRKRIRRWNTILGKRFFDPFTYSFFTVKKAWNVEEYMPNSETPDGSRWFKFKVLEIKTDSGIRYRLPQHTFSDKVWEQNYEKK